MNVEEEHESTASNQTSGEGSQSGDDESESDSSSGGSSSSGSEALLKNINKIEQDQIKKNKTKVNENPEEDPYFITPDKLTTNPINENAGQKSF